MKMFRDCEAGDALGGKAASLVRLVSAGFRVPDGFVVFAGDDLDAGQIKVLIKEVGGTHFAVRSSGSLEDGAAHSFAGQFDTYLNVEPHDVLKKVHECRESRRNTRLVAYAVAHGIDVSTVTVTVVVQKMVDSRVAGVVFTKNPVSGGDDMVVEALHGLGEALVSGTVTPDTYMVSRDGGLLEAYAEHDQILILTELAELAAVAAKVETIWGVPIDIEWAYEKDNLYILQARPITT